MAESNKKTMWLFIWPIALMALLLLVRQCTKDNVAVGERLYTTHCAGCHGKEGKGLKQLVPPLAGADYLATHRKELPCIILNGLEGNIVVNGITYTQPMGGINLSPANIEQIINYIHTSWGNQEEKVDFKEVKRYLGDCE